MTLKCPHCGSQHLHPVPLARQSGATVGGLAGTALAMSGILQGARTGASLGVAAGPIGVAAGALGGALLSGMAGGAVGHFLGSALGDQVDKRILRRHQCDECGEVFTPEQKLIAS